MSSKIYTIDEIKSLTEQIFKKYKVEKAYIFGSYSRGEANNKSDIDIIIKIPYEYGLFTLVSLREDLKRKLKKEVDIISEETYTIEKENRKEFKIAKDMFYKNILEDRKIIFCYNN